jgi:hypothetical protein
MILVGAPINAVQKLMQNRKHSSGGFSLESPRQSGGLDGTNRRRCKTKWQSACSVLAGEPICTDPISHCRLSHQRSA